jgi:hypothetical protein
MYYITFNERLFLAPVVNPQVSTPHCFAFNSRNITKVNLWQAILDVGTGTRIWVMYITIAMQIVTLIYYRDVADEFPAARVTRLDLSPI